MTESIGDYDPLANLGIDDLFEEIAKRCDHALLVLRRDNRDDVRPDVHVHGDPFVCFGLVPIAHLDFLMRTGKDDRS